MKKKVQNKISINISYWQNEGKKANDHLDSENTFDKIYHPFVIITIKSPSIGQNYLNMLITVHKTSQCTLYSILKSENLFT